MEVVTDFIFLGSKIIADGDCSHETKRHVLLERKAMTNLDHILKSRDITLPTKVYIVKAMVFPVVKYGCESWTIKRLSAEELMFSNCGAGEDSLKILFYFFFNWRVIALQNFVVFCYTSTRISQL